MFKLQKKKRNIAVVLCLILSISACSLTGCKEETITFKENQILRVNEHFMTKNHAMVLLCGLQKKYENMFGTDSWSVEFGDSTLDQYIKEQVKTQLVQLAGMNVLANEKGISLSKEEKESAKKAAEEFLACFTDQQLKAVGIKKGDVQELYFQYAVAEKLYNQLTRHVEKEISDDQARMIDVQVIYFKFDSNGEENSSALEERNAVNEKAYQVWEKANAGEKFEVLAAEYNEGAQMEYHIGRDEMEKAFEEAAFQLADGQISGLVEGKEGVYIIKCISNYNQTETDANKTAIYEKNCSVVFNEEYEQFLKKAEVKLNEKAWDSVSIVSGAALPDVEFLDVYESVCQAEAE